MTLLLLVAFSTKVLAAALFAALISAGVLLYRRLGAKAEAAEAEALLDEEFARLDRRDRDMLRSP
jgi:Tfp pilus assembly protein PilN